jgi:hypothetical protein
MSTSNSQIVQEKKYVAVLMKRRNNKANVAKLTVDEWMKDPLPSLSLISLIFFSCKFFE